MLNAYNNRGSAQKGFETLATLKGAILDYNKALQIDPEDASFIG